MIFLNASEEVEKYIITLVFVHMYVSFVARRGLAL